MNSNEWKDTLLEWLETFYYYFDMFIRVLKSFAGIIILLVLVVGALIGGAAAGYFASLVNPTVPSHEVMAEEVQQYSVTSSAYYADGTLISELQSDLSRTPTTIDKVSPQFLDALIAVEDEYFMEHGGIVPKAIIRALMQEALGSESQTGGSTLTQQVIKQQLLSNEVTHKRKVNEILLAMRLEDAMSKEEILEAYVNVSPFGRNNRGQNIAGIQEAAEGIFGVQPADLTLPQAAFLAGLPQSPIAHSPYNNDGTIKQDVSSGLNRKNVVLFNMLREDYITQEEYEEARDYDLTQDFIAREEDNEGSTRQSYIYDLAEREARDIIIQQMINRSDYSNQDVADDPELSADFYNRADNMLRSQGINIYTTIDRELHLTINRTAQEQLAGLGMEKSLTYTDPNTGEAVTETFPIQLGSTIIDNKTGSVLAFIGGRDYDYSNYNIPFDSRRSSGSTIKPIVSYGPALAEHIITPHTVVADTPYSVPDGGSGRHNIKNYGATTNQWLPAKDWLARSQNIPTIKIFMELIEQGIDVEQYVRRLGLGPNAIGSEEFNNPSLSLGGLTRGPTITELVAAYSAFGNNGVFNDPHVIDRIEDANGNVLYESESNMEPVRVWDEATNYLLVDMLRGVTHSDIGTSREVPNNLQFDVDLLSKSGTSNEYKDIWFIGSTPTITIGTWIGYDNQNISVGFDYGVHPSVRNRRLWTALMNSIYQTNPDLLGLGQEFYMPSDKLTTETIASQTGMKPGQVTMPNGKTTNFSGSPVQGLFDIENVPGTTKYNFTVQATGSELSRFWSRYNRPPAPRKKPESSDSSDADDTTDDETTDDTETDETEESTEEEGSLEGTVRDIIDNIIGNEEEENSE